MEALFARLLKGSGGADGGDATDSGCVPGAALSAVACEAAVRHRTLVFNTILGVAAWHQSALTGAMQQECNWRGALAASRKPERRSPIVATKLK
jgi:hypothetical protein